MLVERLLQIEARESGRPGVRISPEVMRFFETYPWPGNIRQMHSVMRVAVALLDHDEDEIGALHLPEELFGSDPVCVRGDVAKTVAPASGSAVEAVEPTAPRSLDELEMDAIAAVMREVKGNVSAAARRLGVSRNTLYRKLGRMS
jgi:DNA-binding NtrC family response regulator